MYSVSLDELALFSWLDFNNWSCILCRYRAGLFELDFHGLASRRKFQPSTRYFVCLLSERRAVPFHPDGLLDSFFRWITWASHAGSILSSYAWLLWLVVSWTACSCFQSSSTVSSPCSSFFVRLFLLSCISPLSSEIRGKCFHLVFVFLGFLLDSRICVLLLCSAVSIQLL